MTLVSRSARVVCQSGCSDNLKLRTLGSVPLTGGGHENVWEGAPLFIGKRNHLEVHQTSMDIKRKDVFVFLKALKTTDMHGFIVDFKTIKFTLWDRNDGVVFAIPSALEEDADNGTSLGLGLATAIHNL